MNLGISFYKNRTDIKSRQLYHIEKLTKNESKI